MVASYHRYYLVSFRFIRLQLNPGYTDAHTLSAVGT
jgi:hypothetical protein